MMPTTEKQSILDIPLKTLVSSQPGNLAGDSIAAGGSCDGALSAWATAQSATMK